MIGGGEHCQGDGVMAGYPKYTAQWPFGVIRYSDFVLKSYTILRGGSISVERLCVYM